jgi:dolichyldiphosphatase
MNPDSKRIFEFTYGEYPASDPLLGEAMVIISFLPHIIAIYTISVMLFAKCLDHFLFLVGLVISHESAKMVKNIWKQPRPAGSFLSSYGMPSDHSMFMFFIASYLILYLASVPKLQRSSFTISTVTLIASSMLVCVSRLFLDVHTVEQVLVGIAMGSFLGSFWYWLVNNYLLSSKLISNVFNGTHRWFRDLFLGTGTVRRK